MQPHIVCNSSSGSAHFFGQLNTAPGDVLRLPACQMATRSKSEVLSWIKLEQLESAMLPASQAQRVPETETTDAVLARYMQDSLVFLYQSVLSMITNLSAWFAGSDRVITSQRHPAGVGAPPDGDCGPCRCCNITATAV